MKTIGIIGTMDEEIICLKRYMCVEEIVEKATMTFYVGRIEDKAVVLVKCGVGQVNAAICTQILITSFNVNEVISVGLAGGINPELHVGDMVISSDIEERIGFQYEKEDAVHIPSQYLEANKKCGEKLADVAQEVMEELTLLKGSFRSDDPFTASVLVTREKDTAFTVYSAEMEGGAIAHTCYLNQVVFVMMRTVSDHVNQCRELKYDDFVDNTARNISKIIVAFIRK